MIGDVLASTLICQHLKEGIPGAQVHYVINSHTQPVVLNNPFVDKIVLFTEEYKKSKWAFYKFLKEIATEKYDVVIDVYGKIESNLITFFSGAPIKISYRKWYSKFIYSHVFEHSKLPPTAAGLAIDNRILLLRPILPTNEIELQKPKIYLSENEVLDAKAFLQANGVDFKKSLIMIGILGSSKEKTYPLPYMAELIDEITKKRSCSLLLNYIPSQQPEAEELYSLCSKKAQNCINLKVFAPSLRFFLAILNSCDAIVSNEGGAVNMAKALSIPSFSIFSPWVSKAGWDTFNIDNTTISVHINDFFPGKIEGKSRGQLKKDSPKLYNLFDPSLFKNQLHQFLDDKIASNQ